MKNLFLCVIVLLSNIITQAQTTQVEIMDLSVIPGIRADIQPDTTDLIILFKINNVNLGAKAYYYFGTVQDAGDVLSVTGNIIGQSGTYYLQVNGVQKEILGYTVTAFIKLSNVQNAGFHYLTVFAEDNNGLITDKLYFEK